MALFVRKINRAKWLQNDIENGKDVSADAVTNCIKTSGNTLSVWQIDDDTKIDDAILAIVSTHQHLDTIDVVCLKKDQLIERGIDNMQNTPGRTLIADLVNNHIDIVNLTYKTLGTVADCIVEAFCNNGVKRYTRGSLKKLLNEAIKTGRSEAEKLETSVYEKL